MSDYSRWYKDGDATVTNGSKTVTGTGTYWKSAGIKAGDMITFDGGNSFREISSVNSDTSITLAANWNGSAQSKASYAIVRNFTSRTVSDVAAQVSDLLGYYQQYISTDMQKIQGKSAYEVAKANGYAGTEAQWLESLKGAGEIAAMREELDDIYPALQAGAGRNSLVRYNYDLGNTFTAEQASNLANGLLTGLYLGARWAKGTQNYRIVGFYAPLFGRYAQKSPVINISRCIIVEMYYYNNADWTKGAFFGTDISDDDFAGGLHNWYIYKTVMQHYMEVAAEFFGEEHIQPIYTRIPDAMSTSTKLPTHYTVSEEKIFMYTPSQILGVPFGDDGLIYPDLRRQIPYYRYYDPRISDYGNDSATWLGAIKANTMNIYGMNYNGEDLVNTNGKSGTNNYKFYFLVK